MIFFAKFGRFRNLFSKTGSLRFFPPFSKPETDVFFLGGSLKSSRTGIGERERERDGIGTYDSRSRGWPKVPL